MSASEQTQPVPLFNLRRSLERYRTELEESWGGLLDATQFVGGAEVRRFEEEFAQYLGAADCVGVANGTDALVLALKAMDLKPGDEVVVPAFTFIATAATVAWLGGKPVFADVEPQTLNLDPASVAARISERTVGIIGVHLYGRPCALEELTKLCDDRGLWFIEDAAQAHGAKYSGRRVGTFGDLATWSFYPAKNLGCFGDGGAVTGSSRKLLERVRRLGNHGRVEHYFHDTVGINSRLDALQAAVLNRRLPLLDDDNARRREIAARYVEQVGDLAGIRFLLDREDDEAVYHQMTVIVKRRDDLQQWLKEKEIGSAVHYPLALHKQPAFAGDGTQPTLPVAEAAGEQVLCLPIFPELTDAEVDRTCEAIREFYG